MKTKFGEIPDEAMATGIIDVDMNGKLGGTQCWCTHTFYYQTTDTREVLAKKLLEGFDRHMKDMINT
jgi:hypothetical protein